ncbi:hypothetical protein ACFVZW_33425 [Streptomyces sp. NPDC059567]|uniref:hypothetical protein n=1 Tax=Streptomyces sp. NPDC059567 TaxID=3346867 RepID=UPI00369B69A0
MTPLPTPAVHARACRVAAEIVAAAAADPDVATELLLELAVVLQQQLDQPADQAPPTAAMPPA